MSPPRIVWVFVGYQALLLVIADSRWPLLESTGGITAFALTNILFIGLLYWFLRGLRAAWWLLLILYAGSLIPFGHITGKYWVAVAEGVVSLALLLGRSMRRYFFRRDVPAEA